MEEQGENWNIVYDEWEKEKIKEEKEEEKAEETEYLKEVIITTTTVSSLHLINEDSFISFNYSPSNKSMICQEGSSSSSSTVSLTYTVSYERKLRKEELKKEITSSFTLMTINFSSKLAVTSLSSSTMSCTFSLNNNMIICKNSSILSAVIVQYTIEISCPLYCGINLSTSVFDIDIRMKESSGFELNTKETQQVVCQCTPVPPPPSPPQCNNCVYKTDESSHLYNRIAGERISLESLVNTVHSHLSTCNVTYMSTNTVVGTFVLQWQYHWKVSFSSFPDDVGNILFTLPFSGNYSLYCCTSSVIDIGGLIVFQEYGPFVQLNSICPSTFSIQLEEYDVGFHFINTTVSNIYSQCLTAMYPDECVQFMLNNTSPSSNLSYFLDIKSISNIGQQIFRITSVFLSDSTSTHCDSSLFYCSCSNRSLQSICVNQFSDCYVYCNHSIFQYDETQYVLTAVQGLNWIVSRNTPPSSQCENNNCRLLSPSPLIATYFNSVFNSSFYTDLYILYTVLSYNTTNSSIIFNPYDLGYTNISTQKNIYSDYQVSSITNTGNYDCNNAFYTMKNITVSNSLPSLHVPYCCYSGECWVTPECYLTYINADDEEYTCTVFSNGVEILKYNSRKILKCNGNITQPDNYGRGCGYAFNDQYGYYPSYCQLEKPIEAGESVIVSCCTGKNYADYPTISIPFSSPFFIPNNNSSRFEESPSSFDSLIIPDYLSPPLSCSTSSSCLVSKTLFTLSSSVTLDLIVSTPNPLLSNNVIWCGVSVMKEGDSPSLDNTQMRFTISKGKSIRNIQCNNNAVVTSTGCNNINYQQNDILFLQCVSTKLPNLPIFKDGYFSLYLNGYNYYLNLFV